jgi:hypothetical protein
VVSLLVFFIQLHTVVCLQAVDVAASVEHWRTDRLLSLLRETVRPGDHAEEPMQAGSCSNGILQEGLLTGGNERAGAINPTVTTPTAMDDEGASEPSRQQWPSTLATDSAVQSSQMAGVSAAEVKGAPATEAPAEQKYESILGTW